MLNVCTSAYKENPLNSRNRILCVKIKYFNINSSADVDRKIKQALAFKGPVICNVPSPLWQMIIPRISSMKKPDGSFESKPYEDMFPFLPEDEMKKNTLTQNK